MADKNSIVSNLMWRFFERCGAQFVSFIVAIILARVLEPEVYGLIALILVFTAVLSVFMDSGLGSALIQKKDSDDLDFSTVFYFNFGFSLILYGLMFIFAPCISDFYGKPQLVPVIRVQSLIIIIAGIKNIQQAYVSKHLIFKKFFFATLGGTILSAVIGIYMAYAEFGIWALVVQSLSNVAADTFILWMVVPWRPKLLFSFIRLKWLLSYGWKLLFSGILDTFYKKLQHFIIGKQYSPSDLAFFERGSNFPELLINNINSSIDSVLFPAMSEIQDDRERVKQLTRRALKTATYIIMPMMAGLAACAEPLVRVLLTDKWLPCVPFLRIFCFTFAFWPLHTANLNAIKALGRSDLFLILEIIKKVIGVIVLLITMQISVMAMACSMIFTSIVSQIINSYPNRKLLDYGYCEQLKDILPQICISILMGVLVYFINYADIPSSLIMLFIQIPSGAALYVIFSKLFKIESYDFILGIIHGRLKN